MNSSTQTHCDKASFTNFPPQEFRLSRQPEKENFAHRDFATNEGLDETWAPMAAFLDAMQEAVGGVDEYLCVKYWNTPMAKLTGVTAGEAMHRPLFSLLPRDFERHLESGLRHLFNQRALGQGHHSEIIAGEFSQRHGDSEFFDFSYRMRVLPTNGNRGVAIITLRPAQEGRQRRKEQRDLFGLLGQLSARIAGELAEPLNTICSKIDNIVALAGNHWSENLEGELHGIITEVYRLSHLANNILTMSSHAASSSAPVDVNQLIPEAIGFLEHTLNRRIACVTALHEGLPPVQGDPILMQSVLQNILRYAVEASGEDAVPRIQTGLFAPPATGVVPSKANGKAAAPHGILIRIEDRGAEIAPEILAKLFDPIACSKQFGIAIGLGLFISKKIVESHGGQLRVNSAPGRGTIFTIALKM
ncbi:MAG: ATP-binding protein [candidate division KSB1 bacterium]|nr:ATP-binding protein [candidate division KSB1 bacterium]MDZ7369047.1 ATP-binding protein [candidate division KSB1 bacterium]MDZ7407029.1 ATP-binding protein [candidate division KSB1 bacterium]